MSLHAPNAHQYLAPPLHRIPTGKGHRHAYRVLYKDAKTGDWLTWSGHVSPGLRDHSFAKDVRRHPDEKLVRQDKSRPIHPEDL